MARRPRAEQTATTEEATTAPIVRRRRRRTVVDHDAQTHILIESLLKGRGATGASQQELQTVILWARGVHAEAAELKLLSSRVRRAKTENAAERQIALDLNRALLDGVLAGSLVVDVTSEGSVAFRQVA